MNLRPLALLTCVLLALGLSSCDMMVYAATTAPLQAPVDSACLSSALTQHLGAPSQRPYVTKRTPAQPATLSLSFDGTSVTQTYADSGHVTLVAKKIVAYGAQTFFSTRAERDSVSRLLGQMLLAVRDACGGRTPQDRPPLIFEQ